jgi:hypothetical protein
MILPEKYPAIRKTGNIRILGIGRILKIRCNRNPAITETGNAIANIIRADTDPTRGSNRVPGAKVSRTSKL